MIEFVNKVGYLLKKVITNLKLLRMAYCCYYAELTRGVKGKVPSFFLNSQFAYKL